MEYASALVKLKPGSEHKLEAWRSTIASRLDEAAATLKDEDVKVESYFTVEISGETYPALVPPSEIDQARFRNFSSAQASNRQISLRGHGGNHGCSDHGETAH